MPEILFDQGVGDVFVVRVAGNVIGQLELDSIDYAHFMWGQVSIIVLGHANCGAVKAVVDGTTKDIESIANLIAPAVKEALASAPTDVLTAAIKANAHRMTDYLLDSKVIKKLVQAKSLFTQRTIILIQAPLSGYSKLVGVQMPYCKVGKENNKDIEIYYKDWANRSGSSVSQGLCDSFWLQGMQGGFKGIFDCIKAFSETDFIEDLKKFDVPT